MQHPAKSLLDQATRSADGIAWKICEEARAERGLSLPDWAPWCFFPIAGWLAVLSRIDGTPTPTPRVASRAALIAALGAWRMAGVMSTTFRCLACGAFKSTIGRLLVS